MQIDATKTDPQPLTREQFDARFNGVPAAEPQPLGAFQFAERFAVGNLDALLASPGTLDRFLPASAFHTVARGETLGGIAAANNTDAATLARINGISDPNVLAVGQRLRLPDASAQQDVTLTPANDGGQADGATQTDAAGAAANDNPVATGQAVTADQIRTIMPNAGTRADDYVNALNIAMDAQGITSPEQRAAFLAQISVESGDLRDTQENLNYSAQRLTQVWPRRFPTLEAAQPYARNPEALANRVYADRLGNGDAASGDGYLYRGRGLMQVTGRDNYRAIGHENDPESLAEPGTAATTAAQWWSNNNLAGRTSTELNRTQFDAISRTVNGGDHGINERWQAYQRALTALRPQE